MVASTRRRYRIFISHSHTDNAFGIRLYHDLNKIIRKGDTVWYDKEKLKLGESWQKSIRHQLDRSNIFILLMSRAAKRSGWVDDELEVAKARAVKKQGKIFVIYCDDCPHVKSLDVHYHSIDCKYPEGYKQVLSKIIDSLGLKTEPEDAKEALIQQLNRQVEWAFDDKDWKNVLEQSKLFIEKFPEVSSPQVYYMKGIALIELNRFIEAAKALNEATACTKDSDQLVKLLDEVVPLLIAKGQWEGVKAYSDYVLGIIPTDNKWRERQELAYTKLGPMRKQTMASTATINIPDAVTQVLNARLDTTRTVPLFAAQAQATASATANLSGGSTTPLYSTQQTKTISLDDFSQQHLPQSQMRQMFHNKLSLACLLLDCIVFPVIFASLVHRIVAVNIITVAVLCVSALIMFGLYLYGWFIKEDWHALMLPGLLGLLWSINFGCFFYIFLYQTNIFTQTVDSLTYVTFTAGIIVLLLVLYCHLELFRRKK